MLLLDNHGKYLRAKRFSTVHLIKRKVHDLSSGDV